MAAGKPPDIAFFSPKIAGNTGAAIRLCAVAGAKLHLVKPFGFEFSDSKLKRAGLDYHDLTNVNQYDDWQDFLNKNKQKTNIYAFTTTAKKYYQDIEYRPDDILLFGPEPDGLPKEISEHPSVSCCVRIPMRPALRSLNLTNSASIALYEAWRQLGFVGGV